MIPQEHLVPYLMANAFALALLALALWRRDVGRWIGAAVFLWAALTNAFISMTNPAAYLEYAALTPSPVYREFIAGWFSQHVQSIVLPIAIGQLIIAGLLASRVPMHRSLGVTGALAFLAAIAPLGVGSGFPFSLTFGAALLASQRVVTVASPLARHALWWSPRLLGLLLSLFLAIFALDAFSGTTSVLRAVGDFVIHLAPAGVVLGVVLLAWRYERLGGVLLLTLAVAYAAFARGRVSWMLAISGPLVVEGLLFLGSAMISRPRDFRSVPPSS